MTIPVLTRSYNNARSCTNTQESVLQVDNVTRQGIRRLMSLPVPGDLRGCEAQPLIIPDVPLSDGTKHDMAVLATMANMIYAYDIHNGKLLWKTIIGTPVKGSKKIDMYTINDHWGILSTPVIDPETLTLYCVSWSSPDSTVARANHSMHMIGLSDGRELHPAISLEGATYEPGHGFPPQKFQSIARKQRSALLLTNIKGIKTVFLGCGSVSENDGQARGWVVAVDVKTFTVSAAFATAVKFSGGGIWQAGQGLSADSKGFLYCMTGNGSFDGKTDWGECILKLQYTPPKNATSGVIKVIDWWSPFSDAGRVGKDPSLPHIEEGGDLAPSNMNGADDMDLGSGGPVCIEEFGIVAGAGKDGILYVTNMNKMGKTSNKSFLNPAANYGKLKSPPIWFTFFPGFQTSPFPRDVSKLNFLFNGLTHHQHSTPVVYDSPVHGKMLFNWGENGNLRAWTIDHTGKVTYLACSAETASPQAPLSTNGGMPGGMLSLSCNGKNTGTGLVWALIPLGDANKQLTPGILSCYDADNFANFPDGSKQIRLLWRSSDWGLDFTHPKFNVPVVSGGKIFVPTYDARIDVYGLA